MSASTTTSVQPAKTTEDNRQAENATATEAAVVITEQEVAFSTAAAITVAPPKSTPWWIAALRGLFALTTDPYRRGRQHQPRRYAFLEASCMARAMDRL
jgi:hypothetical protein